LAHTAVEADGRGCDSSFQTGVIDVMCRIKQALDPLNLMNLGKIVAL
jgi:FAD/FMN-containing dehydrogenase